MIWEGLGKQILTLFTVGALSGASFDLSSDCLGKQILTLFTVGPLSGASFDLSSDCLGKEILTLFAVGALSGAYRLIVLAKRFKHFLVLALEVDKMTSRRSGIF